MIVLPLWKDICFTMHLCDGLTWTEGCLFSVLLGVFSPVACWSKSCLAICRAYRKNNVCKLRHMDTEDKYSEPTHFICCYSCLSFCFQMLGHHISLPSLFLLISLLFMVRIYGLHKDPTVPTAFLSSRYFLCN